MTEQERECLEKYYVVIDKYVMDDEFMPHNHCVMPYENRDENNTKLTINSGLRFTKLFQSGWKQGVKNLTFSQIGILSMLCSNVAVGSNAIYTKIHVNRPLGSRYEYARTQADLATVCNMDSGNFSRVYKKFKSENLIAEFDCAKRGHLFILNPKIVFNGNSTDIAMYELFGEDELANLLITEKRREVYDFLKSLGTDE